jgi:hypothetical protein
MRRDNGYTVICEEPHLLPIGDGLISQVVDTALRGKEIHPNAITRLIEGDATPADGEGGPAL